MSAKKTAKKPLDLTGLVGDGEPAKVQNVVTKPDERKEKKRKPEIPVKKIAVANTNDRRRRTVHFDEDAENDLMRLSGYLMNKGLKPLTEQRMIELALAATFNKDFDLETTYAKLKKKERGHR